MLSPLSSFKLAISSQALAEGVEHLTVGFKVVLVAWYVFAACVSAVPLGALAVEPAISAEGVLSTHEAMVSVCATLTKYVASAVVAKVRRMIPHIMQ